MNGREYVVYLDVFFLINFIMDYLIIVMTSMIRRKKIKQLRKIAAASFGAIYSVIIIGCVRN